MPVYDEGSFAGIIQILEVAEGKLSEVIDENFKLRELVSRFIPREICCDVEDDMNSAYEKMSNHNLPCVPVISSNNVAGVITNLDFATLLSSADFLKQKFKAKR
jgi:CBS domain-containing protein